MSNNIYLDNRKMFKDFLIQNKDCIPLYSRLHSDRERNLVILKLSGYSVTEISKILDIKQKSIKCYYTQIWDKLFKKPTKNFNHFRSKQVKLVPSLIHIFYYNYIAKREMHSQ